MALAPATVQRMPARFNRAPTTCLQPASTTPEETHRPPAQNRGQRIRRRLRTTVVEHRRAASVDQPHPALLSDVFLRPGVPQFVNVRLETVVRVSRPLAEDRAHVQRADVLRLRQFVQGRRRPEMAFSRNPAPKYARNAPRSARNHVSMTCTIRNA